MAVELRHLQAFLAVAQEGHFTHAAAQLHLSQPAVTRMIRQLESHVGAVLLERTTRRVALTTEGENLRDELLVLLPRLDLALQRHAGRKRLRLGFAWGLPAGWAQGVIETFQAETGADVDVLRRDEPLVCVDRGDVDVAIVRSSGAPIRGLRSINMFEENRAAAVAQRSSLAGRESLDWLELADWPLIVNVVSGTTHPGLWPSERRPIVAVECRNFDEWLEAVALDHGIGVLPASITGQHSHPSVRYVPIRNAPPISVLLAYPFVGSHPLAERFATVAKGNAANVASSPAS